MHSKTDTLNPTLFTQTMLPTLNPYSLHPKPGPQTLHSHHTPRPSKLTHLNLTLCTSKGHYLCESTKLPLELPTSLL